MAIDVLWREGRKDVKEELKKMLNIEEIDFAIQKVFTQRTKVAKKVLMNMTPAQREELYDKVDKYKSKGLPEDVQRQ